MWNNYKKIYNENMSLFVELFAASLKYPFAVCKIVKRLSQLTHINTLNT